MKITLFLGLKRRYLEATMHLMLKNILHKYLLGRLLQTHPDDKPLDREFGEKPLMRVLEEKLVKCEFGEPL